VLRRAALLLSLTACASPDVPEPAAPEPAPSEPAPSEPAPAREGSELLGQPARPFIDLAWQDGAARTLADLRGQVVLVRFWTDTCPYCRNTAPRLRALDDEFRARGLTVLGLYHPKPRGRAVTRDVLAATIKEWGLEFPVAIDAAWSTIDAWWLTRERSATSASFLLDRRGVTRLVHPGPEYTAAEYDELHATITALLAEPA
jgi:peroxiredoxin